MMFRTIPFIISILLVGSCTKETQTSSGNPIPVISIAKVEPLTVKQFEDSFSVTLNYEDGDGDLGFINADINSLEVKDTRLSKPDFYYIPPLAPDGSKIHIKGTLVVKLKSLFLLGTGGMETTTLEIRLKDRAGNWSNKVTTPTITITK